MGGSEYTVLQRRASITPRQGLMSIQDINKSKPYRGACIALVVATYYTLIFTSWGNPYHGSGLWSAYAQDTLLVVGAYASIELYRGSEDPTRRASALLAGAPLLLLIAFSLYWAITRYYWPEVSG